MKKSYMSKRRRPGVFVLLAPLLFASAGCAQSVPTVSNIAVDAKSVDATSLRLFFDSSARFVNYRVRFSTTDCVSGNGGTVQLNNTSLSTVVQFGMTANISGLSPGTTYHFCPEVTADGISWSNGSETVYTMPAGSASGEPVPPAEPVIVSTDFPAQTGQVLNVAADCRDLQSSMNRAHYGDTILIPAGTVCTQPITLPNAPEALAFLPSAVNTTTGVITLAAHGFTDGQKVHLSTNGCLPGQEFYLVGFNCDRGGGIRKGKDYFVKRVDTDHFRISETQGGPTAPFGFIEVTANPASGTLATHPDWTANLGYVIYTTAAMRFATTGTLPGGIAADTDYYPLSSCSGGQQVCTFKISLTQGGTPVAITSPGTGTLSIVTRGTGTHYIMAWPPADKWIVVRTATPDTQFTPPGVRTSQLWQSRMATVKQAVAGAGAQWMLTGGILSHNWRFVGIEWTTATNDDSQTTIDPRAYGNLIYTYLDTANLIFDRNYVHGWGYPHRFGRLGGIMDGYAIGFINSELSQMDYWHPWFTGLTPTIVNSRQASLSPGQSHLGRVTPTTTGITTIRIVGGDNSGSGVAYFDLNGVLQVVVPTGITATCETTGVVCNLSSADGPRIPTSPSGGPVGQGIASITFTGGTISGFTGLDGFTSIYSTEGCQCFIMGSGPGPYILDNNYISGTGIPVHFDDSGGPYEERSDYYLHRNTFNTPFTQLAGGPSSDGLRYGHRQPLEFKGGLRIKIDGNRFDGTFQEDTPTSPFIAITPRAGGWVTDVQILNNTFQHGALGIEGCIAIDAYIPVSRPCQRQVIRNNLFSDINGFTHSAAGGFGTGPGKIFFEGWAASDFVIDHNTVASDPRGLSPEFMHIVGNQASNYRITNNILWVPGNGLNLFRNEAVSGCSQDGNKAFVDCVFRNYKIAGNLVIPSWTDTSVPSGAVDPAGLCTAYGGAWSGSACSGGLIPNIVTGTDVPSRIAAVRFQPNGSLRFNSPYTSKAADGRDPGINPDTLNQAQGRIGIGDPSNITSSSVTFRIVVPDAAASCMIGYGTSSNPGSWARTASDTSNSTIRTFDLRGLQSSTAYVGEVWCTGAPPRSLTFSTL